MPQATDALMRPNKYWLTTPAGPTQTFDPTYCSTRYGSSFLSLHSGQDVNDIVKLISKCNPDILYIGVKVDSCYNEDTLEWYDNSPMNGSQIRWCNGYPNSIYDLCEYPYIYFNATGQCISNTYYGSSEYLSQHYACGNPKSC